MINSPLTYALTALLCAALLFSCAPEVDPLPPTNEQNNSSSTKQPPLSQPNRSSSSSQINQSSPNSSPTQSSSSSVPKSSSSAQSSSSNVPKSSSSSSLEQTNNWPRLKGKCEWSKNPTTTSRGATPSGVTLVDNSNICGGAKVVYKNDYDEIWLANSYIDEGTHSGIKATVDCPEYEYYIEPIDCPDLEVKADADYIIECNGGWEDAQCGGVAKKTVTLELDECVEINVMVYNNQYDQRPLVMRCEVNGVTEKVSLTLAFDGKAQSFTGSWNWNGPISIGTIRAGNEFGGILCLTALNGATEVKCTGPSL